MRIRRAELADAAEIARLSGELGYPNTATEIASRLERLLVNPDHFVAVADQDEPRLLGWIAAEHRLLLEYGERVELVGLVVGAEARRTGLGRALVASAEGWARARGVRTIAVRSNAARTESHPFYEGLGYVRTKTQHSYSKSLPGQAR
jgi:GNAT superfamily N-acetyltransferase